MKIKIVMTDGQWWVETYRGPWTLRECAAACIWCGTMNFRAAYRRGEL